MGWHLHKVDGNIKCHECSDIIDRGDTFFITPSGGINCRECVKEGNVD